MVSASGAGRCKCRVVMRNVMPVAVFAGLAVLYLSSLPVNHSEAEDAVHYMRRVRGGEMNMHPNHLLFESLHGLWLRALDALGVGLSVEQAMQVLTVFFALAALAAVCGMIARRSGMPAAVAGTAALSVTFGFWHYGTEADTYIPPLAFALMAFWALDLRPGQRRAVLIGLALAAATLLHQMYVFLAVVLSVAMVARQPRSADAWRQATIVAAVSGGLVAAVYWVAFLNTAPDGMSFLDWTRGHARNGLWTPFSILSPFKSVLGFGTALLSPNALFTIPAVQDAIGALAPDSSFVEEIFVATMTISRTELLAIAAAFIVLVVAGGTALCIAFFAPDRTRVPLGELDRTLLWAIVVYAALATIWEPTNREFWIHIVAFLFVLLARLTDFGRKSALMSWSAGAGALFVINYLSAIEPYTHRDGDYWYTVNRQLIAALPPESLVVTECGYICEGYIRFYGRSTVLAPSDGRSDRIDPSRPIFLSSWAVHPPDGTTGHMNATRRKTFFSELEETLGHLPATRPGPQSLWIYDGAGWKRL